ncbi:hypothetical protein K7432_009895 [Basidiobolus ranarum]|uniref:Yeast cell wall synthesis Kre9/Knh1-like N-terminal domain-containing protein n=1 Tax=Basidiobolus ranarum TaxID=34480 RepID=A0ABR2WPG8_9FUNG
MLITNIKLFLTWFLVQPVIAGFFTLEPYGQTVWLMNQNVTIRWIENREFPLLSNIHPFQLELCSGSDTKQVVLGAIGGDINPNTTKAVSFIVPNVSPPGKLYFLRYKATPLSSKPDQAMYFWSTRFTISDNIAMKPSPLSAGFGALATPTPDVVKQLTGTGSSPTDGPGSRATQAASDPSRVMKTAHDGKSNRNGVTVKLVNPFPSLLMVIIFAYLSF